MVHDAMKEEDFVEVSRHNRRRDRSSRHRDESRSHRHESKVDRDYRRTRKSDTSRRHKRRRSRSPSKYKESKQASSDDEVGPQLYPALDATSKIDTTDHRVEYESRQASRQTVRLEEESSSRAHERKKMDDLQELLPKPDSGFATRVAHRQERLLASEVKEEDQGVVEVDIFGQDEIRAKLDHDERRRVEREEKRRIRDLEKDQERSGRVAQLRAKEDDNMRILHAISKARFG